MKLLQIDVQGVRGAPDGSYRFARSEGEAAPVSLVVGPGPCGKTSLLEAIAAAHIFAAVSPLGALPQLIAGKVVPDPTHIIRRGEPRAAIVAHWLIEDDERALVQPPSEPVVEIALALEPGTCHAPGVERYQALFGSYDASSTRSKLEYFHDERRLGRGTWGDQPAAVRERVEGLLRLGRDDRKYGLVRGYIADRYAAQAESLSAQLVGRGVVAVEDDVDVLGPWKAALARLDPALRLVRVTRGDAGQAEIWLAGADRRERELEELSGAEQEAVLFATAILQQGLQRSLLLVDGPERDMPRDRQADWLRALAELVPAGQIIAATASQEVIDGAAGANVVELAPSVLSP